MKTYQPKGGEIKREWHEVDAKGEILGRLATKVATYLMGKNKPTYSANIDSGDFVVVLNAEEVRLTGKKSSQKVYRSHSGYPGGFKEVSYQKMIKEHPQRVLEIAVRGMLPSNRLRDVRLARLKIVVGDKNPYEGKLKA